MKLLKALNNNVALVLDDHGQEVVVFGTGVGFRKKKYDLIDKNLIVKTFQLNNEEIQRLIISIPTEIIEVTQLIIEMGQSELNVPLAETILVALSDHLNFAIKRHQENILVKSPLHWEIRHLYPQEFAVGLMGLDIIQQHLNISLNTSEASFIALHFVNAQFESEGFNQLSLVNHIVSHIVNIVTDEFDHTLDKTTISYSRFITHLRYFIMRYQNKKAYEIQDGEFLYDILKERYPYSFKSTLKIKAFLFNEYQWDLNKDEIVCLMIHIERLRADAQEKGGH